MPSSMAAWMKKSRAPDGTLLLASRLRGPRLVLGEERTAVGLAQIIAQDLGIDTDLRRKLFGCKGLSFSCHFGSPPFVSFGTYIVSTTATQCARRGTIY